MEKRVKEEFWNELSEKEQNQLYQISRLLKIMNRLRKPEGCPWDRKQTHASLKPFLLEETYEVLEQLEKENLVGIKEELGDLLLQVVFHAQIAEEEDHFSMEDVAKGISDKLVRRHPHVFSDINVENADQVLVNWEKIKTQEKKEAGIITETSSLLDQVNKHQPALMEAQKLQAKAAKVGFDWDDIQGPLTKIKEELEELLIALKENEQNAIQEEIGDLLFAVVNVTRFTGSNGELALRGTNNKFRRRFREIEKKVMATGHRMEDLTLQELDKFWDEAKVEERK
ncbi:MAG: nucleoside triphosphate pyrophosphohydrolase [Halanaerobiales bacterium]|nr:nucleoside triphosphate pyrophosphohydrolase [Halanaerobiales bacterium]